VREGETITANEEIFSLPKELCINSVSIGQDRKFGTMAATVKTMVLNNPSVALDAATLDRASVCVYIAYQRLQPKSQWGPYFDLVPGLEEFEENAGVWLANSSKLRLLKDTHVGKRLAPAFRRKQELVFEQFALPLLAAVGVDGCPGRVSAAAQMLVRGTFRWATALYFSRAILVPYTCAENSSSGFQKSSWSTKSYETITPLIDLLNHRPGTLSALKQTPPQRAGTGSILYSNGRTLKSGEQIFLNYGPRSNADLLAHFGFTLRDNVCDTAVVDVGVPSEEDGAASFKLFRGGGIPEAMLDAVRGRLAPRPAPAAVPASTVYRMPPPLAVGSAEWRASLSAPLDGEGSTIEVDFDRIGSTLSLTNEVAALGWLKHALNAEILQTRAVVLEAADGPGPFCRNVQNYTEGIIAVLNESLAYVETLMSYLLL
jgi:hypothetical protein